MAAAMFGNIKAKASISARVFRCMGSEWIDKDGNRIITPGGQWKDGKEGHEYDLGVISQNAVVIGRIAWMKVKIRAWFDNFIAQIIIKSIGGRK